MEVSRLTFTKDTKNKMAKGLNRRQQGKLRFERLKEAEENGLLQKAKTRTEVAELAGFTREQYKTGYSWVTNMLIRKHLIERISGMGINGRAEYEYHLGSEPDYSNRGAAKARAKINKQPEVVVDSVETKPQAIASVAKLEIVRGDLSIKIEFANDTNVIELVKQLLKGE